jgi:dimethylaniline monooxygenase (N-oxide forming)
VIFEKQADYGGLWRFKEEDGDVSTVMRSTVINTSKEMTAYSDYPPNAEDPNYMHNTSKSFLLMLITISSEMLKYFRDYSDHYGITERIRFNHRMTNVVKAPDYEKTGRWIVCYEDR